MSHILHTKSLFSAHNNIIDIFEDTLLPIAAYDEVVHHARHEVASLGPAPGKLPTSRISSFASMGRYRDPDTVSHCRRMP